MKRAGPIVLILSAAAFLWLVSLPDPFNQQLTTEDVVAIRLCDTLSVQQIVESPVLVGTVFDLDVDSSSADDAVAPEIVLQNNHYEFVYSGYGSPEGTLRLISARILDPTCQVNIRESKITVGDPVDSIPDWGFYEETSEDSRLAVKIYSADDATQLDTNASLYFALDPSARVVRAINIALRIV